MKPHYIITADLHLERVLYGLPIRQQDTWNCIHFILKLCEDPACRGLIVAGDIFHRKHIAPKYHEQLRDIYSHLQAHGRPWLAIDGNHDAQQPSWLDTLKANINQDCQQVMLEGLPFYFYSFRPRAELYNLIQPVASSAKGLILHGRLLELLPWKQENAQVEYDFSARELRDMGLRHATVFMGDLHTYGDFYDPEGDNWFIYPGSVEMTELNEGNIISSRFGSRYDTRKKCVRFYPGAEHGQNWELVDLPNRPYLRQVIPHTAANPEAYVQQVDTWVQENPHGILCLLYPEDCDPVIQRLNEWRRQLLVLRALPLSQQQQRALAETKAMDILEFATQELNPEQMEILRLILTQDNVIEELKKRHHSLFYANNQTHPAQLVSA